MHAFFGFSQGQVLEKFPHSQTTKVSATDPSHSPSKAKLQRSQPNLIYFGLFWRWWQFFTPNVIENLFESEGEEIVDLSWEYTKIEMHKNRSIKY